ncbi:unnamed protein product [Paramecium sonneborni]|uniref:Uncharacterized protein n=1 Tax=Paramecium sonneborni TaxID=65129 RepID=A0A8S1M307_9CILI|nr:unnamed protein product [Paramecium sonneborni]
MKALILLILGLSAYAFTEQMMSLEELGNFNVKTMDCSRSDQFSFIEKQMKQWEDLLIHQKAISHDIKILEQMEKMLTTKHHSFLEAQVSVSGKKLLKKLHKLELPLTKSKIGLSQVKALREQCHALDSESHEDRTAAKKELCRLLREYINSLNNCRQQCRSTPITVIKIKGQIKDLEIIRGGCSNNGSQNGVKVTSEDDETHEITIHHHHHGKTTSQATTHSESDADTQESVPDQQTSTTETEETTQTGEETTQTGEETTQTGEETTQTGEETTEEETVEQTGEETTEETTEEETVEQTGEETTVETGEETTEETTQTGEETTQTGEETTETTETTEETTETTEETTQTTEETTDTTE